MRTVLTERRSFRDLLGGSESGRIQRGKSDVNVRPLKVTTLDGNETWTFRYKSDPSTTGNPWHGYVQFFKEDVSHKDNAEDLECMIDCDCPDYRYRYAYNNAKDGVGRIGKYPEAPSGNQNNGRKWRPRSQGGVGDYGVGLCKHLCALSEYLKTKIQPDAPEPGETPEPSISPKPTGSSKLPLSMKPTTINAPTPEDSYSDSRTGSDTLQEQCSLLYERFSSFVRSTPEFEVQYEAESTNEIVNVVSEEHDRGEWWIDETGSTVFADGNVGDSNHEAVVIGSLIHEIISHFGINEDEPDELTSYEDQIKQNLIDDGRLDDDELAGWDNMSGAKYKGPSDIIIKKLVEDKVYKDPKQTEDAVYIAYGSGTRDAREFAMKYWRWKVMKTDGTDIEIQTWHLKPEDLSIIVRGVWEIMGEDDPENPEDSDNNVGEDGYPGPRINVTVQASGKRFIDIPLAVLEKKMPQNLHNYQSGVHTGYTENINEDYHLLHKEYRLYEGNRHIVAIFEDNTRLKFEVHFRNNHKDDREKHRKKAASKWKTLASKLHSETELTEQGNPIIKPWKECFDEALRNPEMKEYIRHSHEQKVFDPVNFTRMG